MFQVIGFRYSIVVFHVIGFSFRIVVFQLFGLVKGSRVAVIIDASEANLGFGRQGAFSESLVVSGKHILISQPRKW